VSGSRWQRKGSAMKVDSGVPASGTGLAFGQPVRQSFPDGNKLDFRAADAFDLLHRMRCCLAHLHTGARPGGAALRPAAVSGASHLMCGRCYDQIVRMERVPKMKSVSETTPTTSAPARRGSPAAWFVAGLAAAGLSFFAGHQFWPGGLSTTGAPPAATTLAPAGPAVAGQHGLPIGESTIADIASDAVKSVVNIDTRTSVAVPDFPFHFGLPFGGLDFFFGPGPQPFGDQPRKFEQQGTGSGVIIRPDGYILTNNHVIRRAQDIKVTLADRRMFKARVVGRDSFTDLALLKIDASNLPVARLGTSKGLRPGDWAIAIGSPLGLDHSVTLGIVSALGRSLGDGKSNVELIQTDAAINPGNSGGPLLNIHGEVIGINTAIRSDAQNIGFSIPVDVARQVADGLIAHGSVPRPYVGIYMQDLDPRMAKSLGLPESTKGVLVARVAPGSPAEQSGVAQGDVILRIEGKPVASAKDVRTFIRSRNPGSTVHLLLNRNGSLMALQVKIGEYPSESSDE